MNKRKMSEEGQSSIVGLFCPSCRSILKNPTNTHLYGYIWCDSCSVIEKARRERGECNLCGKQMKKVAGLWTCEPCDEKYWEEFRLKEK